MSSWVLFLPVSGIHPRYISPAFNLVIALLPAHVFRRVQVILSFFLLLITFQLPP